MAWYVHAQKNYVRIIIQNKCYRLKTEQIEMLLQRPFIRLQAIVMKDNLFGRNV